MKLIFTFGCVLFISAITTAQQPNWLGDGAPKPIVKLYGEGGIAGVEAYQTGLLISLDHDESAEGWILTVDSPALGSGDVMTVFHDGERLSAQFHASDPSTELALLKVDLQEELIPCYQLGVSKDSKASPGQTLYVVSNTFNIATGEEDMTVQRTSYSSLAEVSISRLGSKQNSRQVLLMDAVTSNPGTAGGAVLDRYGSLVGMIGKESRSDITGNWINYAIQPKELYEATYRMINNLPSQAPGQREVTLRIPGSLLSRFGACFVPTLADRAPPLIEHVDMNSLAANAGLASDDLIVSINSQSVSSARQAEAALTAAIEVGEPMQLTILRDGELIELATELGGLE